VHLRPWPAGGTDDDAASAAKMNAQMENLIRECPQQYLWGYARYKAPRAEPHGATAGVAP
jgi:KDO2-lipid IV(A) lauroyltransferase